MQQYRAHTTVVPPGPESVTRGATWHRLRKRDALLLFAPGVLAAALIIPDEILLTFSYGGGPALVHTLATAGAIALFIALTLLSWHRGLTAYPAARGDYDIALANLGPNGALLVAIARLVDAGLFLALCLSAATRLITSTLPLLQPNWNLIAISCALILLLLRIRQPSLRVHMGVICATLIALALLVIGFAILTTATPPAPTPVSRAPMDPLLGLILIVYATTSGGALLGGLGAMVSVCPDFPRPQSRSAITVTSILAAVSLAAISALTLLVPTLLTSPQWMPGPVISTLATTLVGSDTALAALLILPCVVLLILAARTALKGLPTLIDTLSRDSFLPHHYHTSNLRRAHRTTSTFLIGAALAITLTTSASPTRILPLYVTCVLLIATFNAYAMIRHWNHHLRQPQSGVERRLVLRWRAANVVGFMAAGIFLLIVAITRFMDGVWISLVVMGSLFAIQRLIRRHYEQAAHLRNPEKPGEAATPTAPTRIRALIVASTIDGPTWHAVTLAKAAAPSSLEILAVADPTDHGEALHTAWEQAGRTIPLTILDAPNRDAVAAILDHLHHLRERTPNEMLMVYLPEILTPQPWLAALHNHDSHRLARKALAIPGVLTVTVPWTLTDTPTRTDATTQPATPPPNDPFKRTPPGAAHTIPTTGQGE